MKKLTLVIIISLILLACNNSTEPKQELQQEDFSIKINTYQKLIDYSLHTDKKLDSVKIELEAVVFNSKKGEIKKSFKCKLKEYNNSIWHGQNILWTTASNGNVKFVSWKGQVNIWKNGEKRIIPQEYKKPF